MNTCVPSYKWSKVVKNLWGNKCAYCGKSTFAYDGGRHCSTSDRLEAHHIRPRSRFPELANDLTNGIALCHDCHLKAHGGWGYHGIINHDYNYGKGIQEVIDFVDSQIIILIPKGRKKAVEARAKQEEQTVNRAVNRLLAGYVGLTYEEWKDSANNDE